MTRARDLASGLAGVRPFAMAAGNYYHTSEYTNITFPSGRFTQPPRVTANLVAAGAGGSDVLTANITTTGMTFQATPINRFLDWHAVQMTSGAASG